MRVTTGQYTNNNVNFKGLYNNKILLNGLEKIAEHPATFVAATTFAMSAGVRPLAIMLSPCTDKENKRYACANSISSAISKFAVSEAIALPVEHALKKIDKTPEKYLNKKAITKLKDGAKSLQNSPKYTSLSQLMKLSTSLLAATPKTMIAVALIPFFMKLLFNRKAETKNQSEPQINKYNDLSFKNDSGIFKDIISSDKNPNTPAFKGPCDILPKTAGKILGSDFVINTVTKHPINQTNLARNMSIATDLFLTASFATRTAKSKKIEENRKKPLIYNNIISTAITLAGGCFIDNAIQKNNKNFVDKFVNANKNNPKLDKYVTGLNIARPTLIFAGIYYGLLPLVSTSIADKTDKLINGKLHNAASADKHLFSKITGEKQ